MPQEVEAIHGAGTSPSSRKNGIGVDAVDQFRIEIRQGSRLLLLYRTVLIAEQIDCLGEAKIKT